MKSASINGWQDVQAEVLKRLHDRFWKPGDLLPSEADLAAPVRAIAEHQDRTAPTVVLGREPRLGEPIP